jgi:hypothetical protein
VHEISQTFTRHALDGQYALTRQNGIMGGSLNIYEP